jgi:hypothetical protein
MHAELASYRLGEAGERKASMSARPVSAVRGPVNSLACRATAAVSIPTGYGGPGRIAWGVRQQAREGPGNDAGVGGPACCSCGYVDRLIA